MRPQTNWLVDAALLLGLLAGFFPNLTGIEGHQWLGVFGGGLVLVHLSLHWPWIGAVTRRLLGGTSNRSRLHLLLDGLILLEVVAMVCSGLVLSTWLGLTLTRRGWWLTTHILASIGTLFLVVLKLALHWRWIVGVGSRVVTWASPRPRVTGRDGTADRRAFLGVMGVVGLAAGVALVNGASGLLGGLQSAWPGQSDAASESDPASAGSATPSGGSTPSVAGGAPAGSSGPLLSEAGPMAAPDSRVCTAACGGACSFPGRCRRYTDGAGNGLCDRGECA